MLVLIDRFLITSAIVWGSARERRGFSRSVVDRIATRSFPIKLLQFSFGIFQNVQHSSGLFIKFTPSPDESLVGGNQKVESPFLPGDGRCLKIQGGRQTPDLPSFLLLQRQQPTLTGFTNPPQLFSSPSTT